MELNGRYVQGRRPPRIIGGHKRRLGVWGGGLEDEVRHKLKLFCETTHNICVKIQQTTVAVSRVDILNDITYKILGGHYHGCPPPFINIGGTCPRGTCPPCPLGIDAPGYVTAIVKYYTLNEPD